MAGRFIPIKRITSWSFSRYSDYKACPLKAKLKHLDKINEPPNPAMARGAAIHNMAEDYLKGKAKTLSPDLKLFEKEFKQLREIFKRRTNAGVVEDNWAFTKDWQETQWNNWAHCWVRIKLDCAHFVEDDVLVVTDWKTGKFRPEKNEEYVEQLELYALAALLLYPHLSAVYPYLAYTDQGTVYPPDGEPMVFTRDDVPKLTKLWAKRVAPMMNDKIFAPRANEGCRWCWYGQSKKSAGGPGLCKY